jgi:hypothetical protein
MGLQSRADGINTGRRRALAGLVAGTVALAGGASRSEAGKKKRKKRCPTCPAATVCPPPDTCPARKCCQCQDAGGAPVACRVIPADGTINDCAVACTSGFGSLVAPHSGFSAVCDVTGKCIVVACPI